MVKDMKFVTYKEDIALGSGTMPDHSGSCVAEVYYSEKGQRMLMTDIRRGTESAPR